MKRLALLCLVLFGCSAKSPVEPEEPPMPEIVGRWQAKIFNYDTLSIELTQAVDNSVFGKGLYVSNNGTTSRWSAPISVEGVYNHPRAELHVIIHEHWIMQFSGYRESDSLLVGTHAGLYSVIFRRLN